MTTLSLRVDGMTCAACTARVERMAGKSAGVTQARANLLTHTLTVQGNVDPTDLAQRIAQAGFSVPTQVTRLAVSGMTCATCVGRVERALTALPGVTQAQVNLAAETATVTHLGIGGIDQQLVAAAARVGYQARVVSDDARDDLAAARAAEHRALGWQVLLAGALTLPLFVTEMGGHLYPPLHHWLHAQLGMVTVWILQFVLASAVLFGPGLRFYRAGVPALLHGSPDMNSLVVLGASAAWGYSTVATFAPDLLPPDTRAVYFEAAAVIVTLILLGRWLEARAKGRAGAAIARLVGLQPKTARAWRGGDWAEVALAEVIAGDRVLIRPGERIPVDGALAEGQGHVDESMITGEPVPVHKTPGDALTAGTLNGAAALTLLAERVGGDTVLAQIIRLVEEAQGARLPIQALVDRVVRVFVPVVMAVAVLTFGAWMVFGPAPALTHALVAAVAVLIIACPCAMGLATPTSIMVGSGRAAELGVLFRRGDALQSLGDVQVVAFDKTGTLTEGRPDLVAVHPAPGWDESRALALAAAAEVASEHPIAQAVVRGAQERGLAIAAATGTEALTGFGLQARVDGLAVLLGAHRLMVQEGVDLGDLPARAHEHAARGHTPIYLAVDGQAAALIVVADRVKPTTAAVIAALHGAGVQVAMITGDAQATAQAIAADLRIDHVEAEVLPAGKVAAMERLRAGGRRVAFVGDGINDAPALAAADVGLAIGTGTDVAIEAAEVVLMSGDLRGVLSSIALSRAVLRNIRQNLFWAFAYNAALIPVAAGVLYPAFGLQLSPPLAAGAMALSSLFVLTNAMRLKRFAPDRG